MNSCEFVVVRPCYLAVLNHQPVDLTLFQTRIRQRGHERLASQLESGSVVVVFERRDLGNPDD